MRRKEDEQRRCTRVHGTHEGVLTFTIRRANKCSVCTTKCTAYTATTRAPPDGSWYTPNGINGTIYTNTIDITGVYQSYLTHCSTCVLLTVVLSTVYTFTVLQTTSVSAEQCTYGMRNTKTISTTRTVES